MQVPLTSIGFTIFFLIFSIFTIAVYDGHGGAKIASHVSKHLHKTLVRRPEYKQGNYEEAFVKVGFLFNLLTLIYWKLSKILIVNIGETCSWHQKNTKPWIHQLTNSRI